MKKIVFLALVLIASMFFTTPIVMATVSIFRIDITSEQTLRIENVDPLGDPIDGKGPPGITP